MCYYYDGDGVCEDFERETSVKDCGLYTPNGFLDQWATTVEVSHEERLYCPADVAAGYPAVTKVTVSPASARCTDVTIVLCEILYFMFPWRSVSSVKHSFYLWRTRSPVGREHFHVRDDLMCQKHLSSLHTLEQRVPD